MESRSQDISHTLTILGHQQTDPAEQVSSSHELPTDLNERGIDRLGLMAVILGTVIAIEGVVSHAAEFLLNSRYPDQYHVRDAISFVVVASLSFAAAWILRSGRWPAKTRLRFGFFYLIVIAYLLSFADHADHFWRDGHNLHGLPGVIVLLLVFPVVIPLRPMRALWLALAMAATGPVAMYTLHWGFGYQAPHLRALVDSFPFLAAPLAAVLAHIVHSMGVELKRARRLGQYELEEQIGEGGMGVVYVARHAMMRRPTAIKLLPAEKAGAAAVARFEREVQLTAKLTHPNTITIYDYGRTADGVFYYAMELLNGATLSDVVKAAGPLPPERVVRILHQVAGALAEAHSVGLIHRDIKPANIMLVDQGGLADQAKVLDFGLVKELDAVETDVVTRADSILGTPQYIAPETVRDALAVDNRADIYALGAVGYFLLTAEHVFLGKTVIEVCASHLRDDPIPPTERLGAPVPEALEALVLHCLAKAPEDRPQSMSEIQHLLEGMDEFGSWTNEDAAAWWDSASLR